jgi:hypothetical protein
MRGGETPEGGVMKFGTLVEVPDVMNYANFHLDWMNSFCASSGQNMGFSL